MPYEKMDEQVSVAIIRARLARVEVQLRALIRDTDELARKVNESLAQLKELR